ncbi:MAG: thiamine diphosphokinase [Elusimicrobiaceae bacterium]|nr:thiamine diphosphokinase [Elusimicrobiaceae bacterium]
MRTYRALLIGNGETVSPRLLKQLAAQADYVLAADGGADKALQCGVTPNGVIGDLDSVSARTKKQLASRILHVPTQDNTDLEKALLWLNKNRFTHVTLVGFVGDRWDFAIGNLLALTRFARKLQICVAGNKWRIFPLVRGAEFACKKNKRVSIIPVKTCTGVTLTGLKYPLKNARLLPGTTQTLSNQTTATRFKVSFTHGTLLVYYEV